MSVDPDSEIIDDVTVTPANAADQDPVEDLLGPCAGLDDKPEVMGDSAYAGAELRERLDKAGFDVAAKVPPASNRAGLFTKDDFRIDLDSDTVRCPAGFETPIERRDDGTGTATFGDLCGRCPLRERCTTASRGRTVSVGRHEATMQQAKTAQADPDWQAAYRQTRPKVERKIGHLTRRAHGGRKARCRGVARVLGDFVTRAAAINLAASRHPRHPSRQHRMGHRGRLTSQKYPRQGTPSTLQSPPSRPSRLRGPQIPSTD